MAGQFVLWKISNTDKDKVLAYYHRSNWTSLAHRQGDPAGGGAVFPGWTQASRDELNNVRNGSSNLANRNGLPPHRYLEFPGGAPNPDQLTFLKGCHWIQELQRPSDQGFGVVGLNQEARKNWGEYKKLEALINQITAGAVSIEIYYLGSKEMT